MRDGKGMGKAKENFEDAAHHIEEGFEYIDHDEPGPSTSPITSPDSPQNGETSHAAENSSATPPTTPSLTMKQHYEGLAFKAVHEGNVDALKALLGSPAYVFNKTWETRAAIELATAKLAVAEAMVEYLRTQNPIILREQYEKGQEVSEERRQQVVNGIKKDLAVLIEKMVEARTPEIMARYAAFPEERLKHWDVNPAEQIELLRLFLKEQFKEPALESFLENLLKGGKKALSWGALFQDIQTHYKNEVRERQNELQRLQATLQSETSVAEREYIHEIANWSLNTEAWPFIKLPQEAVVEIEEGFTDERPESSRGKGKEKLRATPQEITRRSVDSEESFEAVKMLTANQKRILASKVNPNAVNEQGDTLLLCALRQKSKSSHVIRQLLFSGAEPRIGDASSRHLTPIDIVLEMPETSDRDTLLGVFAEHAEVAIQHPLFIERRHQLLCKPENWQSLNFVLKTHAAATVYLDAQTPEKKSQFIKLWESVFAEIGLAPTVWNAETAIDIQRKARKALLCTDPLVLATEVKQTVGKSIFTKLAALTGSRIFAPLDGFYRDYRAKMEKLGHPDISKALIRQGAIHEVEQGALAAEVSLLKRELRESRAEKEALLRDNSMLRETALAKDEENQALIKELAKAQTKADEATIIAKEARKEAEQTRHEMNILKEQVALLMTHIISRETIPLPGLPPTTNSVNEASSGSSNAITPVVTLYTEQRKRSFNNSNNGSDTNSPEKEQPRNSSSSSNLQAEDTDYEDEKGNDTKNKTRSEKCSMM